MTVTIYIEMVYKKGSLWKNLENFILRKEKKDVKKQLVLS